MAFTLTPNLNKFCIYFHYRKDTNVVFYIGKGSGTRPYSKSSRSNHWHYLVNKTGYAVKLIATNLLEAQAFKLERRLILLYNKKQKQLVNKTEGGEGISGFLHSLESRQKMSKTKTGISVPCSLEKAKLISQAKINRPIKTSKTIQCIDTQEIFKSVAAAARAHQIDRHNLAKLLAKKGSYKTLKGRRYKWLTP